MENVLAGQSDSAVIAGLQAVLPHLLEQWNNVDGFNKAAIPVLIDKLGLSDEHGEKVKSLAEQALRQVFRLRTMQFRSARNMALLDGVYTRLVTTATDSPTRQGFLWLAFQAQKASIEYLETEEGGKALSSLKKGVDGHKTLIANLTADKEKLTIDKIEKILTALGRKVLEDSVGAFQLSALAGSIVEWVRSEARGPPEKDLLSSDGKVSEEDRLLTPLLEPVRQAEMNESYHRFLRMSDAEKRRRFDILRKTLHKHIKKVALHAPQGFEKFCMAVEGLLFPYPAAIEWMRSYLKPIYANAQQSSIFDNCLTEPAISQRYEKMIEEKSANLIMLELSMAFALSKLTKLDDPEQQAFISNLKLDKDFGWPKSLEELKSQMSSRNQPG